MDHASRHARRLFLRAGAAGALPLFLHAPAVAGLVAASKFRLLHSFAYGSDRHTGGARPRPLTLASDGNFYGVSVAGGEIDNGTIFRMRPRGATVTLYSFRSNEGFWPDCKLVQASDGHLYGTTSFGGAGVPRPAGTIFRLDSSGVLTVLHTFDGPDGAEPRGGVMQASDGHLYGTTASGGMHDAGVAFRLSLGGEFTVLHHFGSNERDGQSSRAPLVQASDGFLYGTTYVGGRWLAGTLFRMGLDGAVKTVHEFGSFAGDASGPANPVVEGTDGRLYGAANFGGPDDQGALFRHRLGTKKVEVTGLYARPSGGLLLAGDGHFYGTAFWGGASDKGWIFRATHHGVVTPVHSFSGDDGANPAGQLAADAEGRLFGVAQAGGTDDAGVAFRINP